MASIASSIIIAAVGFVWVDVYVSPFPYTEKHSVDLNNVGMALGLFVLGVGCVGARWTTVRMWILWEMGERGVSTRC